MAESGRCVAWRRESSCWFFISFLMEKCPSERSRAVGSTLGQDPGRGGRAGSHPHHTSGQTPGGACWLPPPSHLGAGPRGRVLAPTPITAARRPR